MRLKQLLGVLTLLLVFSMAAAAADSQLTKVSVASQGNATTVTLQASGAFTHNEYRPAENLLLVDLAGVNSGKFNDKDTPLKSPGVKSYRVMGYTGAGGKQITRFELTLASGADVQLAPMAGGVQIRVTGGESAPVAAAKPAPQPAAPPKPAIVAAEKPSPKPKVEVASAAQVRVNNISVSRGKETLDIEIDATGALAPRALRLTHPDRVVVDLANAVARPRTIPVNNGGVTAVRMARHQDNPVVTRVVVDMTGAHDYDLAPEGNKVILRIHTPAPQDAAAPTSAPAAPPAVVKTSAAPKPAAETNVSFAKEVAPPAPIAAPAPSAEPKPEPQQPAVASNVVMVEPKVQVKPASPEAVASLMEAAAKPATNADSGMLPPPSANFAQPAINLAQQQQQQMAKPAAPQGPRYTGEPISVNLKDVDLRDFFRLIHEISGLNIVLDPNVRGTLTLVLDDVPWDQALDIVLKNNSLDKQLEGNVLRIATIDTISKEADARRNAAEKEALAVDKVTVTRFLSYAHSKDVVPTLKKFLSQRGDVISDDRTNALIIQDIPNVIPEIDRLIQQLDRKTQEVAIEARVVAATRSFARDIGMQLGFAFGNSASAVGGTGDVGTTPTKVGYVTPPPYPTTSAVPIPGSSGTPTAVFSGIPLFSNLAANKPTSGIGFTNLGSNYRLDAVLTMAESRGLLKVLSRPHTTTQNNMEALVRQGVKVPVVTQAQLQGPPTVTYVEAFLRMTVTPQITIENTIFLNIDLENTTPDFSTTVGGNPTLVTQQVRTSVLVTDGGTVVIGGVIQSQNSVNTQQVPLLGDIPMLGNLFKRRSVSTSTQELIFFIMPKIIQT